MNKRPPKNGEKIRVVNTLLVDGNALFKRGFFGAKDEYNHRGEHIGGVYQFLTVLRKLLSTDLYHRVYVFWDGLYSGKLRYEIYAPYKSDRGKDYLNGTQPIDEDEVKQKGMIWNYLEELCIRQLRHPIVESDDFIGYYCLNKKPNDNITICTTDRDMCQLISENVRIYFCDLGVYVTPENYNIYFKHHLDNAALLKIITGDNSDSIKGVKGLKEGKLLSLFPEIKERQVLLSEIIEKSKVMQADRIVKKLKPLKVLDNIINQVTLGVQGNKLYEINTELVDLKHPKITQDAIEELEYLINSEIDMENRSIKTVFHQMKVDGLEKVIGPYRYADYLVPFKQLIERENKETNKTNVI